MKLLLRWLKRRTRPIDMLPAPTPVEIHEAERRRLEETERRLHRIELQRDLLLRRRDADSG